MLKSMTAFSRVTRNISMGTISMEISSVNHRYQEISVRLPREQSFLEPEFFSRLKKRLKRGKIRAKMEVSLDSRLTAAPIDMGLLEKYYSELEEFNKLKNIDADVNVENLLQLPGVIVQSVCDPEDISADLREEILSVLSDAIDSLLLMREQEGRDLEKDILHNLEEYTRILKKIEQLWTVARERTLENFKDRVLELAATLEGGADEARLAQEIALLSDKWDISEEISRSSSHLDKFEKTLENAEPVGRKLDFLLQEMNREINTVSSKVSDADIRWLSVEGKTYLERIREQVQNVE